MADSNPYFNFFIFKDNGYTTQVIISFKKNKINLSLRFFDTNYNSIGTSNLDFDIANDKIEWGNLIWKFNLDWINQDCKDYCDKLLKLRAFA